MEDRTTLSKFVESAAARKSAHHYPWMLAGLTLLYVVTFFLSNLPILVAVPVMAAGWFYYRRGGVVAGMLAFLLDLGLINYFTQKFEWRTLLVIENGLLIGHAVGLLLGFGTGYLREIVEADARVGSRLRSREYHLALINKATRDVLEMKDPGDVYHRLVVNLKTLFSADLAYLTRWDSLQDEVILVAASGLDGDELRTAVLPSGEASITRSVLESGEFLMLDDVVLDPTAGSPSKNHKPPRGAVLAIPLVTKDSKFGAIILGFNSPHRVSHEEVEFIQLTSSQIGLALRTVQQEYKIEKQLQETNALTNIERILSMSERVGVDAVLQLIVDSAKELIPKTKHVVLHLLDEERKILMPRAVAGLSESPRSKLNMRMGQGVAGQVLQTGETIYIPDIRVDSRFLGQTLPITYRSLLVAPVKSDERRIGTISIHSDDAGAFNSDDANLLGALGIKATIALENADLLDTTRQDFKEINTLYHLTRNLATSLDPDVILKDAVNFMQDTFHYYHVQIFLVDFETGNLLARHGAGSIGEQLMQQQYFLPAGKGIVGTVAETGEPFFTNNVNDVMFYVPHPLLPHTHSEMALPIKVEGRILGVLDVQELSSRPLSFRQMKLMDAIANQLAVALQKANLYTDLQTSLNQEKSMRSQLMQSERLAVIGQLLASVSHELNNPIQAIQNALFLLKNEEELSNQGRQDLEVILSETERMASLIGRLRATYRPAQAEEIQEVQLNSIIQDIQTLVGTYMRHRGVRFEFETEPDLPVISGIPDQLRQVMLNLFMNAIDAMQSGGSLKVRTFYDTDQEQVLLSIKDTGAGIDPKILPHIFEPFITGKNTGTGLGLTITRDIILQHHGAISGENDPDGGAIFRVRLPVRALA